MTEKDISSQDDRSYTSTELLNRCKNGDNVAWENFIKIYEKLINGWIQKYGIGLDKDDVRQEIMLRLLEYLPTYDRSRAIVDGKKIKGSFRGWLRKVVSSRIMESFKSTINYDTNREKEDTKCQLDEVEAVSISYHSQSNTISDEDSISRKDKFFELFRQRVSQMEGHASQIDKEALQIKEEDLNILYEFKGLEYKAKEVGEHYGISAAAVRTRVSRLIRHLQYILGKAIQ